MKDILKIRREREMVTAENAEEGRKVLINNNGGDFNFQEGDIVKVERVKTWAFVTVVTEKETIRRKVRKAAHFEENAFSLANYPYIEGDQSDIYYLD